MRFPRQYFEKWCQCLTLNSKEQGRTRFVWNSSQRLYVDEIAKGLDEDVHRFVFLKSRQMGISTISLALDLFWLFNHRGMQGAFVANNEKVRELARSVLDGYQESLPREARRPVKVSNRNEIRFANASRLSFLVAGGRNAGQMARGEGINFCHATECSSYGDDESIVSLEASMAETHPERLYVFESSARGFNLFHDMWENAKRSKSTRAVFLGWWAHDAYQMPKTSRLWPTYGRDRMNQEERAWAREVQKRYGHEITQEQWAWWRWKWAERGGTKLLLAEFPFTEDQAFVMTGSEFFPVETLQDLYRGAKNAARKCFNYKLGARFEGTEVFEDPDGALSVWEEPIEGTDYVIAADPAYGESEWADCFCLSPDTEILTDEGWKTYDKLSVGMNASCFDLETSVCSFQPISRLIVKDHDGDMMHFQSRSVDCLATPEHRMVAKIPQNGKGRRHWYPWEFRRADDLPRHFGIPLGSAPCGDGVDGLSLDMCRVLGWLATDGHRIEPKQRGNGAYVLAQAVTTIKRGERIADNMAHLLREMFGMKARRTEANGKNAEKLTWYFPSKVAEEINPWLGEGGSYRIARRLINECSREQLEALFLGLMEGDGTAIGKNWVRFYPGYDHGLADDLQEIAMRLGYGATKRVQPSNRQVVVNIARRKYHYLRKRERVPYQGKVWCVTVPTGAFVARRNGRVFVTGNCVQVLRCGVEGAVQVAEFNTPDCTMYGFAWVLAHLAGAYGSMTHPPTVILELGGPGRGVLQELQRMPSQYSASVPGLSDAARGKLLDIFGSIQHFLYRRPDTLSGGRLLQWETTWKTKQVMMNLLRDLIERGMLRIQSPEWIDEARYVTQNGNSIQAEGRSHKDDRVIALALAAVAWQEQLMPQLVDRFSDVGAMGEAQVNPVQRSVAGWLAKVKAETDERNWQKSGYESWQD